MLIPVLHLPLTLLIAAADSVPNWDVTGSCRGAARAGYAENADERLKSCMESEKRTREKLAADWSTYPAADRTKCIALVKWFSPTYTELVTCLEMSDHVRKATEKRGYTEQTSTMSQLRISDNAALRNGGGCFF